MGATLTPSAGHPMKSQPRKGRNPRAAAPRTALERHRSKGRNDVTTHITRETFRRYVALAHAEASNAQRLMIEGMTTCAGFPVVEDGNIRSAITRLEIAAQTLREGLARIVDQQEGESQ